MVFTTWLTNLPKQLTRRSSVRKVKTGLWSRSSDAAEVLETRALLAVSDFDGGYDGTYSGSVTIPGQGTFSVPGVDTLSDNSFTANISNGSVNVNANCAVPR